MATQRLARAFEPGREGAFFEMVVETPQRFCLIDLTLLLTDRVFRAGMQDGVAHVQTRHTTTGLVVNENEPLLLQDLRATLERLVPEHDGYGHDDLVRRGAPSDEPRNAAAHCRALLLPTSQCLAVRDGRLSLGRWQSLFFVELDGPRRRSLALSVIGVRR